MRKLIILLLLACCSGEKPDPENATIAGRADSVDHYALLAHAWQDTRDSSHVVILAQKLWVDMYNGDTVSENAFTLYSRSPEKGGLPMIDGKTLWLEESPGNFYEFEILRIDSLGLEMRHIQADRLYTFSRKDAE
jgi:hypothetical protein